MKGSALESPKSIARSAITMDCCGGLNPLNYIYGLLFVSGFMSSISMYMISPIKIDLSIHQCYTLIKIQLISPAALIDWMNQPVFRVMRLPGVIPVESTSTNIELFGRLGTLDCSRRNKERKLRRLPANKITQVAKLMLE